MYVYHSYRTYTDTTVEDTISEASGDDRARVGAPEAQLQTVNDCM
jgi:hypothetical protein